MLGGAALLALRIGSRCFARATLQPRYSTLRPPAVMLSGGVSIAKRYSSRSRSIPTCPASPRQASRLWVAQRHHCCDKTASSEPSPFRGGIH